MITVRSRIDERIIEATSGYVNRNHHLCIKVLVLGVPLASTESFDSFDALRSFPPQIPRD